METTEKELFAPVKKGQVEQYTSKIAQQRKNIGTSNLGKQEFLQLLVAQMQYQDPLNPSSDTEWVSQMATFSSLEQMQNMNGTMTNSQAFSMIGSTVSILTDAGKTVEGKVDFVTIKNGISYLSVEGNLYEASNVQSVIGMDYISKQKAPVVQETALKYDHQEPNDVQVKVSMGIDEGAAGAMVVYMNGRALVPNEEFDYDAGGGVVTIKKEAFGDLNPGTYPIIFAFDDQRSTIEADKVKVTVSGIKPEVESKAPSVKEQELAYDHQNAKDVAIDLSLGSGKAGAKEVTIHMNGKVINPELLAYNKEKGTVTVKADAFKNMDPGSYMLTLTFDDKDKTMISDKVKVTITGTKEEEKGTTA